MYRAVGVTHLSNLPVDNIVDRLKTKLKDHTNKNKSIFVYTYIYGNEQNMYTNQHTLKKTKQENKGKRNRRSRTVDPEGQLHLGPVEIEEDGNVMKVALLQYPYCCQYHQHCWYWYYQ